jgi:hypothetical protein
MPAAPKADAVARLTASRQAEGDRKLGQVRAALAQLERDGAAFSTAALARAAQVSRRFLYAHAELLAEADAARMRIAAARAAGTVAGAAVTAASLRADLENARAANARLRSQLAAAETRLAELLGAEAPAGAGWVPPAVQRQLDEHVEQHQRDQVRIRELQDELEQARRLNRELTAQLNRPAAR